MAGYRDPLPVGITVRPTLPGFMRDMRGPMLADAATVQLGGLPTASLQPLTIGMARPGGSYAALRLGLSR